MRRNLDDRVETVVPIEDPALKQGLIDLLHQMLADRRLSWALQPDGHYTRRTFSDGDETLGLHDVLMRWFQEEPTERAVGEM